MRVLLAVDIRDDDLREAYGLTEDAHPSREITPTEMWDDLVAGFYARLGNFYSGTEGEYENRARLVAMGDVSDKILKYLLDAAEVGLDGVDDEWRDAVAGTLITFRQHFDAQGGDSA